MMRGKKIAVLCAGLLVFCLAGAAVLGFSKPLNDQITVDGLSGAAAGRGGTAGLYPTVWRAP